MKLCFATNNEHKLKEIQAMLGDTFEIVSLSQIHVTEDIPETADTIEANSAQKANYIFDRFKIPVFADDTGLEVLALNNEPGVYSARYAGPDRNNEANMALVLQKLDSKTDRSARFKTVITLVTDSGQQQFTGTVEGVITHGPQGEQGFGYDPIFQPKGYDSTFAQMSGAEKNKISHRGIAFRKLVSYLQSL